MAGTCYHVFLCHRGPDAKRTIVNALYEKLKSKGISSFVDYEIEDGTEIKPHIVKAIENSLFFIIILSPGFARSQWCLDEVAQIMRVKNSAGSSHSRQSVLPIFYNIEPFEVRHQITGSKWDLSKVKRSTEEQRKIWSEALRELSLIKGIEYKSNSMFQGDVVKQIVSWVESNLNDLISCEKDSKWREQIEELEQMLTSEAFKSKDAFFIGVHGTNAREFSDHVVKQFSSRFDVCSILPDEADPIEQLYSDLIGKVDEQTNKLKFSDYAPLRLQNKRCLLVLHDHAGTGIKHLRPLLKVVKQNFKNQSLMVFTSRFQHRLREVEVDEVIRLPSSEDNGGLLFICHGADIHQSFINHLEEIFCMRGLDVHLLSENEVLRDSKCLENARVILAIISNSLSIKDFQRLNRNTSRVIYISYGRHSTNESSSDIRFDLEVRFEEATRHYDKGGFKLMVEKVMKTLNQADEKIMDGPDFPVGLVKRRDEIESHIMLRESESLQAFGLVGMGGIGKTTAAMSIYNRMHKKFEASFFCLNIREHAGYNRGLVDLQAEILQNTVLNVNKDERTYDIEHRKKKIKINNVENGKTILKSELMGINALIVLDDVDCESHIDALYRPLCTLGAKSVVVITTRNRDSLKREQLTEIFEMPELDEESSERLFHWHAFLKPDAPAHLKRFSQDVIAACKGLPLSLKVIGSYLYGHESESEISKWEESLRHLQEKEDIFGVLRISYDHLRGNEKEAFLDICCFLIGNHEDIVCMFLEGCYRTGQTILDVLKSRSLVSTDAEGQIRVHDQLRDMGRHIVREGKKDRVWEEEETANDVLEDGGRLSTLRGLSINIGMCFPENDVAMCPELRILVVNNGNMSGIDSHRHNSSRKGFLQKVRCRNLRWLTLENASFEHLPLGLCSEKLRVLNLSGSNIREVPAALPNLQSLWLRGCKNLKVLSKPIGTLMPSLRGLDLYGCSQLEGLDSSLGELTDLRILNLSECRVPSEIAGLPCMQELYLSNCTSLTALSCPSTSLQILSLYGSCNVERLNLNVSLPNLQRLSLDGCTKLKVSPEALLTSAPSLRKLDLSSLDCEGSLKSLDCEGLPCMQELYLQNCTSLTALSCPSTSLQILSLYGSCNVERLNLNVSLPNLQRLILNGCTKLKVSPEALLTSAPSLRKLDLSSLDCEGSLKSLDCEGLPCMQELYLQNCTSLTALSCPSTSLQILSLYGSCNVERLNLNVSLPNLQRLILNGCTKLKVSPEALLTSAPSLRKLDLCEWGSLKSLDCEGLPCMQELYLQNCTSLTALSCPSTSLQILSLYGSCNVERLNLNVSLPNLQRLILNGCTKLKVSPEALLTSAPSLRKLDLSSLDCEGSLKSLDCEGLPCMQELYLQNCTSLTALSCPSTSLQILWLNGSCNVERLNVSLPNLQTLMLKGCTKLKVSPEALLTSAPSLRKLELSQWDSLKSLDCEGLSCLQELYLIGCTALTTLSCLSTSLQSLYLDGCCNLERLNLNVTLSNLQKLSLRGCTRLKTPP
ncbi:hypothetical protein KP509_36G067300 [Ceratopteris richardii]|uniref:TIR domain-containing protein n=1 Tax=Ceratopteris richardii TaxID=49495 RepID=A0A8T2QE20_CERRI|nr:hypothetical protein KP509_36G067300 [Ceratopteris richardii]